jgi:hypothetical protein
MSVTGAKRTRAETLVGIALDVNNQILFTKHFLPNYLL